MWNISVELKFGNEIPDSKQTKTVNRAELKKRATKQTLITDNGFLSRRKKLYWKSISVQISEWLKQ